MLGNKNADGTEIEAEKVVFGYFPQIAATIKSVNASGNEIVVTDLATKKPVTIRVIPDSIMKKLPEVAAQALARRYGAARGGAGGDASAGGKCRWWRARRGTRSLSTGSRRSWRSRPRPRRRSQPNVRTCSRDLRSRI